MQIKEDIQKKYNLNIGNETLQNITSTVMVMIKYLKRELHFGSKLHMTFCYELKQKKTKQKNFIY